LLSRKNGIALMLGIAVGLSLLMLRLPPIPQWPSYHNFADHRTWLGIPNFGNVASNLAFAVVGIWGLTFLLRLNPQTAAQYFVDPRERWPYTLAFFGMLLTAFGSAYYHLAPNNARLVWDRIPMTVVFGSLVAAVIAERISVQAGMRLLPFLLAIGARQRTAVVRRRTARPRRLALLRCSAGLFDHRFAAGAAASAKVLAGLGFCRGRGILCTGKNSGTRRPPDFRARSGRQRTYAQASVCGGSGILDFADVAA
jgi:hypothetical protein